jgi:hypothetical protein
MQNKNPCLPKGKRSIRVIRVLFTFVYTVAQLERGELKDRWEKISQHYLCTKKFFPKLFALPENVCSLALSILNPHPVPKDPLLKFYSARVPDLIIFY